MPDYLKTCFKQRPNFIKQFKFAQILAAYAAILDQEVPLQISARHLEIRTKSPRVGIPFVVRV
jgi:hypothetical protein